MVSNPSKPNIIGVTISTVSTGQTVKIQNVTAGSSTTGFVDSSGKVVFDLANLTDAYAEGDEIVATALGKNIGGSSGTVVNGGLKLSVTTAACAFPSVSL